MESQLNERIYSIEEIEEVIVGFETATIELSVFKHGTHLMVAAAYLMEMAFDEALSRMRTGLKRILARNGGDGYHETITVFWMRYTEVFLLKQEAGLSKAGRINRLLASCNGQALITEHYSKEVLASDAAKAKWTEPDLRAITRTNSPLT